MVGGASALEWGRIGLQCISIFSFHRKSGDLPLTSVVIMAHETSQDMRI